MAFGDLSWLWETLNSIVSTVTTWFSSLWTQAQNITNTGQGLFSGLVAFGSQLWDAIIKAFTVLGEWLGSAFQWIYNGLKYLSDVFGQWISNAFAWIGSGLAWVGQQFYNFGNWLWNSLQYVGTFIINAFVAFINTIIDFFAGVATAISSWWGGITNTINTWWSNLVIGWRNKIKQSIIASSAITIAWKSAERISTLNDAGDIMAGALGIVIAPYIGQLIADMADKIIPIPTTTPYPLVPTFTGLTYTPPYMNVTPPTTPPPPDMGTPPSPPGYFTGVHEQQIALELTYDMTWASKDSTCALELTYEVVVA